LVNASTLKKSAAMDPKCYWESLVLEASGADDVEIQTIFRDWVVPLVAAITIALETC
jgi:hypothetical protein